jgi:hypothetical protein
MFEELFNMMKPDLVPDSSPEDSTEITTSLLLFYSKEEAEEFKELCKKGIREEYGLRYREVGNVSDFLLKILRKHYGSNKSEKANV